MSASTLPSRGAVHPRISPGDRGLDRGMVASYLPAQSLGTLIPTADLSDPSSGLPSPRGPNGGAPEYSVFRSSFSCWSAATNWMVETSARRVGSVGCSWVGPSSDSPCLLATDAAGGPSIRRCRGRPMLAPAGISRSASSESNSVSRNVQRSSGKFSRTVCARWMVSMAISTKTYRVLMFVWSRGTGEISTARWELGRESLRTKATMSVVHQHVAP